MTGFFTFRGRLNDLAMARLRQANPTEEETRLVLALGQETLSVDLSRDEAEAMVLDQAIVMLRNLHARGRLAHLVVCSRHSVAADLLDGVVSQLIAKPEADGSMSVEILVSDNTFDLNVRGLRRRRTDQQE